MGGWSANLNPIRIFYFMSYDYISSLPAYKELGKDQCRQIVFSAIKQLGSCNDREISEHLNWAINRITPRRGELVNSGLIMQDSKKLDPTTGRTVSYWKTITNE
jgi:hypothetical protein